MLEFVTEAVVLDKIGQGEQDARVYLYTEELGKISAKAKSLRKITSRLAAHLEPGNLVSARIIDKNGPQVIDALTISRSKVQRESLQALLLLKEAAVESQPDSELWGFLKSGLLRAGGFLGGGAMLSFLGFDPQFASCAYCGKSRPESFYVPDSSFYCGNCAPLGAHRVGE